MDSFANSFANSFYEVLFDTGDLFNAVRTARRMNIRGAWYSPAVYLRHKPTKDVDKLIFKTRNIDTAVPEEAIVGNYFLVRLWIRRPTTLPHTGEELRKSLGISEHVEIMTDMFEADVKFEKVEGKEFRIGEVLVKLQSTECEIKTENIRLFVDENRDAPPAIFVVKVNKTGKIPLVFSVWQDQNMIASIIHQIDVVERYSKLELAIETISGQISVGEPRIEIIQEIVAMERRVEREETELRMRSALEYREMVRRELSKSRELELRIDKLRYEVGSERIPSEVFRELERDLARIRELKYILERIRRDIEVREFFPKLYYEYRNLLEELAKRHERIEFLLERVYHETEKWRRIEFESERLSVDVQRAERRLPVFSLLLRVFQVCPMMSESSVLDQMRHFTECGRCISYIMKEPQEEELHPLLKGFLVFCYEESTFSKMEHDVNLALDRRYFDMLIHRWGSDIFRNFRQYLQVIPSSLERDYLKYKMITYRR